MLTKQELLAAAKCARSYPKGKAYTYFYNHLWMPAGTTTAEQGIADNPEAAVKYG